MARTSRKNRTLYPGELKSRIFNTAFYMRISVLDGDKEESESIENQENLLQGYIEGKSCFVLRKIYKDCGKSGVNFQRSGIEQLLGDIRDGLINCVIVKDLSRFGRNYLETGEYLEKILPSMGIRFIAVNDGYDNIDPSTSDNLTMHLKNLVNDIYARDISQKVCPVLLEKQRRGEFIGAWAPYGYLKSEEDSHKLAVDKETAPIVRRIYQYYLCGLGYGAIAGKLKSESIPSPSVYRLQKGIVRDQRFRAVQWRIKTIHDILSNPVYTGNMVQGKKRASLYKGQEQRLLPEEEWIVVKDTHEPIIDQDIFDRVQQKLEGKKKMHNEA